MSHDTEQASTSAPQTTRETRSEGAGGVSMRGALHGVDGYSAQAARLAPTPVQMRRSMVQREETALGVPEVSGDARAVVAPRVSMLRERLVQRRTTLEAQVAQIPRSLGDGLSFSARTAPQRREIQRLEEDIANLASVTDADPGAISRIATRHAVPVQELDTAVSIRGNSQTAVTGLSEAGVGLTQTETQESVTSARGRRGVDSVTASRTTTANVDTNGLNRSTSRSLTATDADGTTASRGQSSSTTIGSNAGGLGLSTSESTTATSRGAGREGAPGAGSSESRTASGYAGVRVTDDAVTASGGRTRSQSETTYARDGASDVATTERRSSGSATVDDEGTLTGASITQGGTRTRSQRDAQGNETSRESRSTSGTVGYVNGDEGEGVTLGGTVSEAHTTPGAPTTDGTTPATVTSSGSLSGTGTFTDQQVGATGQGAVAMGVGPVSVNGSLGGGMSFRVNVREVPDTRPKRYDLVTTFRYEISLGVGTTHSSSDRTRGGDRSSGSVGVGASARRVRTSSFSNRMTVAEAAAYQAEMQRIASAPAGRVQPGDGPALKFAARLRAFAASGNFPTEADLLGDGREMEMNSRVSIGGSDTLGANANAQLAGGVMTAGAAVSVGSTSEVERTRERLMVDGRDTVRFVLTFADTRTRGGSANASALGVGGTVGQEESTRQGNRVVIDLDPNAANYRARERQVLAVSNRRAADRLATQVGAEITRESRQSTTDSVGVGFMDGGEVGTGLTTSATRSTSSRVTTGRAGPDGRQTLSGGTSGSSSDSAALNVGGVNVANVSSTTTAEANVDSEGHQHIAVSNTSSEGLALPAIVQQLWRTTEQQINSIDISEGDMAVLVRRAANATRWRTCLAGAEALHVQGPWETLRSRLQRPRPEADWVRVDREVANKIARGQAITNFIGNVGAQHGRNAIQAVMRNYDRTEALGTQWEWPDDLRAQERSYNTLRTTIRGARERFAAISGESREELIQEEVTRVARELERIKQAVASCGSFRQETTKPEMLGAIDRDIREIHRLGNQATAPAGARTQAAAADAVSADEGPDKSEQMADAKTFAFRAKRTERTQWQRSQGHMREARERIFTNCHEDVQKAMNDLLEIERSWQGPWGTAWRTYTRLAHELRQGASIDYDLRTNVDYRIQLMNQAVALDGSLAGFWNPSAIAARWRSQGGA